MEAADLQQLKAEVSAIIAKEAGSGAGVETDRILDAAWDVRRLVSA
jgi:hypothetical protein